MRLMSKVLIVVPLAVLIIGCGSDDIRSTAVVERDVHFIGKCIDSGRLERIKPDSIYTTEKHSDLSGSIPIHYATVEDSQTGLIWDKCLLGQYLDEDGLCVNAPEYEAWPEVLAFVQNRNKDAYQGFSDWRLPNAKELLTLFDTGCDDGSVMMNTNAFPMLQSVMGYPQMTSSVIQEESPSVGGTFVVRFYSDVIRSAGVMSPIEGRAFIRLVRGGDNE